MRGSISGGHIFLFWGKRPFKVSRSLHYWFALYKSTYCPATMSSLVANPCLCPVIASDSLRPGFEALASLHLMSVLVTLKNHRMLLRAFQPKTSRFIQISQPHCHKELPGRQKSRSAFSRGKQCFTQQRASVVHLPYAGPAPSSIDACRCRKC